MSIPADPSGGSDDLFLTSINEMNSTNSILTGDTNTLSSNMDYFWYTFEGASASLPANSQS